MAAVGTEFYSAEDKKLQVFSKDSNSLPISEEGLGWVWICYPNVYWQSKTKYQQAKELAYLA